MPAFPIPVGPGTSVADLSPSPACSRTFDIAAGDNYVVTFNPVDPNDAGILSLYDSTGTSVLDMPRGGSYPFVAAAAGTNFYFKATKGARNASIVEPTLFY